MNLRTNPLKKNRTPLPSNSIALRSEATGIRWPFASDMPLTKQNVARFIAEIAYPTDKTRDATKRIYDAMRRETQRATGKEYKQFGAPFWHWAARRWPSIRSCEGYPHREGIEATGAAQVSIFEVAAHGYSLPSTIADLSEELKAANVEIWKRKTEAANDKRRLAQYESELNDARRLVARLEAEKAHRTAIARANGKKTKGSRIPH